MDTIVDNISPKHQSKRSVPASAIALAYQEGEGAPKVVAKGNGMIAEQIIEKAKENKVFVHESKELVSLLMQVDLDDNIPPSLYQAIAEILAWLYQLENGMDPEPLPPFKADEEES